MQMSLAVSVVQATAALMGAQLVSGAQLMSGVHVPGGIGRHVSRSRLLAPRQATAQQDCLSGGDEKAINAALAAGGVGKQVVLCPSSTFSLQAPVVFTAAQQSVYTQGLPTGDTRATLKVAGSQQSAAVVGNCGTCADISLHHVQVDGSRPSLGRIDPGDALIEFGGPTSGQVIDHVHAFEPRAWSALHVAEGSLNCEQAQVTNNQIGPSGQPNEQWADGISMACRNSLVQNNVITDATDGAIVLFGAPGTRVLNNRIVAASRTLLGGINMVDYAPYAGDYAGTTVDGNVINSTGAYIKTGMAIGPAAWGDDVTDVNRGGIVTNNQMVGLQMGYGIAISGAQGFTVTGNVATANFGGMLGASCHQPLNAAPAAFVYDARYASGTFQPQFVNGRIEYAICVQPGRAAQLLFAPGQLALTAGQSIQLTDASLAMQGNGRLRVSASNGATLWQSAQIAACGNDCALDFTQQTGLVVRQGNQTLARWPGSSVDAVAGPPTSLRFSAYAPYLSLYGSNNDLLWASSYAFEEFLLKPGQFMAQARGSVAYLLLLESDANLRVRRHSLSGTVVWQTSLRNAYCGSDCFSALQGDGNLVTYSGAQALFATDTQNSTTGALALAFRTLPPYLQLQDSHAAVVWSSGR